MYVEQMWNNYLRINNCKTLFISGGFIFLAIILDQNI